jgi:hypothetical protein
LTDRYAGSRAGAKAHDDALRGRPQPTSAHRFDAERDVLALHVAKVRIVMPRRTASPNAESRCTSRAADPEAERGRQDQREHERGDAYLLDGEGELARQAGGVDMVVRYNLPSAINRGDHGHAISRGVLVSVLGHGIDVVALTS